MAPRRPIAYAAGPLGFSEAGRLFHTTVMVPILEELGFEVRDPWVLTPQSLVDSVVALSYGPERKTAWQKVNPVIGKNNADAIEESDVVVAVLDGVDVDSGTAGEIGYASRGGTCIIGYRGDFRLSSDNEGSIVNLQIEYFIHRTGGEVVTSIISLRAALIRFRDRFFSL